mmetsp:Transcript_13421/g.32749  ORF Transcript_13421/g.32749 Transcript_13421/m.32749 type:complete len:211 (+) Transcript_13421:44-676(+)
MKKELYSVGMGKNIDMTEDAAVLSFSSKPRCHVQRKFNAAIHDAYGETKDDKFGQTLVVAAASHVGKTHAVPELLLNVYKKGITRGKLVPFWQRGLSSSKVSEFVAESFNIQSSPQSFQRLFLAFEGKESEDGTKSTLTQSIVSAYNSAASILNACNGGGTVNDEEASRKKTTSNKEYRNEAGQYPPVIVLDGVYLDTDEETLQFLSFFF